MVNQCESLAVLDLTEALDAGFMEHHHLLEPNLFDEAETQDGVQRRPHTVMQQPGGRIILSDEREELERRKFERE